MKCSTFDREPTPRGLKAALVCLSCYSKTLQTGWFKQRHLLLTVLDAVRSKTKVPVDLVPGEHPLPDLLPGDTEISSLSCLLLQGR